MGMQRQAEQALFLREAGAINKDHMADKGGRCHLKRPLLRAEVVLGIVLKALQEVLDFFFSKLWSFIASFQRLTFD